jgi:AcrR family transcriptional regulator
VADVVAGAETSRGTFYLYFRNKEAIFAEVLAEGVDELYRSVGGPQPDLRAAMRAYLEAFAERAGLWRCTIEAALESPAAAAIWMAEREQFMERVARRLRADQAAGRSRPLDAALSARALGAMVEWFAFTSLVVGDARTDPGWLDRAADALATLWDHAVHPDR